ncbi:hypothetical protein JVU11DRAFT_3944 [Chiua virens]|nr:hypothetical protein JVU11DRAFT_3944 [Chiua virens]
MPRHTLDIDHSGENRLYGRLLHRRRDCYCDSQLSSPQHNLTSGNAYIRLAQVAMTRVLYRRYMRGELSEKDW